MKNVLLSGSSGQLGKAICNELIQNGYFVIGLDLNKNQNKKNFINFKCDITKEAQVKNIFIKLKDKKIYPDILINNAGIGVYGKIEQRKAMEIKKVSDVNLLGTINLIKNYYLHLKINDRKLIKKIINISSIYGVIPPKFDIYEKDDPRYSSEIYGATKSGLIQLTKYFAKNFSGKNIIVNSLSPGGILNKKLQTKKFIKEYKKNVPLRRMANVKDIIDPLLFMCSDQSNYINGQNIVIDGGFSC